MRPRTAEVLAALAEGCVVRVQLDDGTVLEGEVVRHDRSRTRVRSVVEGETTVELTTELSRDGWKPVVARRADEGRDRWRPADRVESLTPINSPPENGR